MSQQSFILTDGSNDVAVLNSSPVGTEYGVAVRIIGAAAGGTSSSFTQAFPGTGTAAGFNDGTNMQGARVFDLDSGAGTQYVLGVGLRLSSSGGSVEAGTGTNPIRIDPTGTTTQPISGTVTANAGSGTFTVSGTVAATQSGTWTVQGSGNFNNASIGAINSAVPASATFIGGSDGTNLQAPRVYDLNTSGATEFALGVNLRSSSAAGSKELSTDANPLITIPNSYYSTRFGEARVVNPYTLIDLVNKYEIDARQYGTSTATGGTVTFISAQSAIRLSVTGTNGSQAKLRTHTFFRYQAGKEMIIKQSSYCADAGQANQTRRWGFFDDNDGIFWELSGTTFRVVQRSSTSGSVVDTQINQSSWNQDKLDGTGISGVTLDLTKANIYEIHFQWLGVGYVEFYVNGIFVHIINNPNTIAAPYMKTAQLPLSWEITNTGTSTTSSFTYICSSVLVGGGERPEGTTFGAFNSTAISVTNSAYIPILSIRPKATYNSLTNRAVLLPFLAAISTQGARISYKIIMNGTLTGASFNSVDATSTAEFDVAATALSGGQTLLYGLLGNANDSNNLISLDEFFQEQGRKLRQDAFATTVDILTIVAINEAVSSTSVKASFSWKEVR